MEQNSLSAGLLERAVKSFVDMSVPSIRCPLCGFPLRVAGSIRWRDNGTISLIFIGRYSRIIMVQTGLYDRLFSRLNNLLGISIDHILFEAQRNISRSIFDSFARVIPPFKLVSKFPLLIRIGVEGLGKGSEVMGMAHSTTLECVPGDHVIKRFRNPYNIHLLAAYSTGGLEFLEGRPFRTEITDEGYDRYLVRFSPTSEKPAVSERLKVEKPVFVPGSIEYDKCRFCHAPKVVSSRFRWIQNDGIIVDTKSESRVIVTDGILWNTVLRELAKELGDEVYKMLVSAQREWTLRHIRLLGKTPRGYTLEGEQFEEAFEEYLGDLPVFGYGNPVSFEVAGPKVKVVVENPFQEEIIAGTLEGIYQAFSGRECRAGWKTTGKATVEYSIEPA